MYCLSGSSVTLEYNTVTNFKADRYGFYSRSSVTGMIKCGGVACTVRREKTNTCLDLVMKLGGQRLFRKRLGCGWQ